MIFRCYYQYKKETIKTTVTGIKKPPTKSRRQWSLQPKIIVLEYPVIR